MVLCLISLLVCPEPLGRADTPAPQLDNEGLLLASDECLRLFLSGNKMDKEKNRFKLTNNPLSYSIDKRKISKKRIKN